MGVGNTHEVAVAVGGTERPFDPARGTEQQHVRLEHFANVAHEDALEDAREVAQIENVVEFRGRRQHLREE